MLCNFAKTHQVPHPWSDIFSSLAVTPASSPRIIPHILNHFLYFLTTTDTETMSNCKLGLYFVFPAKNTSVHFILDGRANRVEKERLEGIVDDETGGREVTCIDKD